MYFGAKMADFYFAAPLKMFSMTQEWNTVTILAFSKLQLIIW